MSDPLTSTLRPGNHQKLRRTLTQGSDGFVIGHSGDQILLLQSRQEFGSFPCRPHHNHSTRSQKEDQSRFKAFNISLMIEIQNQSAFKAFQKINYDTLKIYVKAHGFKTQNLIINLDHDEWTLTDEQTLQDAGCENEMTLSFYNHTDYEKFKANPEEKWM
jgi:Uncharacterized conserved protein (DUF2340)